MHAHCEVTYFIKTPIILPIQLVKLIVQDQQHHFVNKNVTVFFRIWCIYNYITRKTQSRHAVTHRTAH